MKIAAIQMAVGQDKMENVMRAGRYLEQAAAQGADLAVLPEMFCCPYQTELFPIYAEREGQETWKMLAGYAKTHGIYLVAGSMPELGDDNRVYNTSYVFDRRGRQIGKHRKVHLFDIDVEGGQYFKESDTLWAGEGMTLFETEFGTMGLCICFDIRFPELFGQMAAGGRQDGFCTRSIQYDYGTGSLGAAVSRPRTGLSDVCHGMCAHAGRNSFLSFLGPQHFDGSMGEGGLPAG